MTSPSHFVTASPLRIVLATLFSFFAATTATVLASEARPNILFITSDDHAFRAVGAYGSRINRTPHIDRIANEGVRFDRCYVTNSICGPSRACILTGKYSHKNGFYDNRMTFDGSQTTFPKLLRAAGYQTAIIGSGTSRAIRRAWIIGKFFPVRKIIPPRIHLGGGENRSVGLHHTDHDPKGAARLAAGQARSAATFHADGRHKAPHRPWDPAVKQLDAYEKDYLPELADGSSTITQRAAPPPHEAHMCHRTNESRRRPEALGPRRRRSRGGSMGT